MSGLLVGWGSLSSLGCAAAPVVPDPPARLSPETLVLGQTTPVQTELGDPQTAEAWRTWLAMIGAARDRLDIAQFYVANEPDSRLEKVLQAIEAAAKRGVQVRFLVEARLCATYPKTVDRLAAHKGIAVRRWKTKRTLGGILHAKYFLVDHREAWIGSQNFDWRSLEHIHELGVRVRSRALVTALGTIFSADWALAGGSPRSAAMPVAAPYEVTATMRFGRHPVRATVVASPRRWLPARTPWDLPELIRLIDNARDRVRVQLLSLHLRDKAGRDIARLQNALRRAGERGVKVQILLSHWMQRRSRIEDARTLQRYKGVTVKMLKVPEAASGFIPFARVIHAKYLVVDGHMSWLGTSNWSWVYFHQSRNVGVLVDGRGFAATLDRIFERLWDNDGAAVVKLKGDYPPPRISR